MQPSNCSTGSEFLFLGLLNTKEPQVILFVVFLSFYLLTVIGNCTIIVTVRMDHQLQTPMYFFLHNLSFLEIWYTTTIVPKLLANLLATSRTIMFVSCMAQLYFFVCFGATECYILSVMAYDRYLAICNPLHYATSMSDRICTLLALACWISGILTGLLPVLLISRLCFCASKEINHFFCDIPPLLSLSCTETYSTEISIFFLSLLVLFCSFLLTVVSYVFILTSILKIPSAKGRRKAFSTCGSHLTVVVIFYGTMIFMYVRPRSDFSTDIGKVVSVFYTVVTPVLNPVIYSLRNKEFIGAMKRVAKKCIYFIKTL
ncbi:olfactory receptor 11L1-like [Ambystoma mexicanum]|uniref:olfactory receptor 11L1-like n=1 Tax=Ambystoma mexicanum TaxID=8296 RepID=UPI0037E96A5B